jgi:predicted nucleotidyltransferase
VPGPEKFKPPTQCLRDIQRWLKAAKVRGAIIGGVASGLLGTPRVTRDVDLLIVIDESEWPAFLRHASGSGFDARIPDALEYANTSRVLLMRHRRSKMEVDVALGSLEFERELIRRAKPVTIRGLRVMVCTPEDLVILKAIPRRPNDLADIRELLHHHPRMDVQRVRRIVGEFSEALDCPDILHDLEGLLARHKLPKER